MAQLIQSQLEKIVEELPESFLDELPAANPPPGASSNLVDPPDKGPSLAAVASFFAVLASCMVLIRAYCKCVIVRKASWDDRTHIRILLLFASGSNLANDISSYAGICYGIPHESVVLIVIS